LLIITTYRRANRGQNLLQGECYDEGLCLTKLAQGAER